MSSLWRPKLDKSYECNKLITSDFFLAILYACSYEGLF